MDKSIIKGLRRPMLSLQRSLIEPSTGVRKNPTNGDRAQTNVMCWCSTPIFNKVGDTNAVSAAYENSIPITAADTRTNSIRVLCLQIEIENDVVNSKYITGIPGDVGQVDRLTDCRYED